MRHSVQQEYNRLTASWKNRHEVNSTIQYLGDKIAKLQKSRNKELKNSTTKEEKLAVRARYDGEIADLDYLQYLIKLNYYEIIGKMDV